MIFIFAVISVLAGIGLIFPIIVSIKSNIVVREKYTTTDKFEDTMGDLVTYGSMIDSKRTFPFCNTPDVTITVIFALL